MINYNNYFSLYESTDPPPIITDGYKKIHDNFTNYSISMPTITHQYEDPFRISTQYEEQPIEYSSKQKQTTDQTDNYIINYFLNKGLTLNQAKGIYGNIMQESSGKVDAKSKDGYESYGLAQWTGERKDELFKRYGYNPTAQQQLDFLWWELNNTHKDALDTLLNTNTVYEATKVFMDKFERPNKKYANFAKRLKYANNI